MEAWEAALRRWKLLNKFLRTDTDTDNSDKDTKKLDNCGTKVVQALLAKQDTGGEAT